MSGARHPLETYRRYAGLVGGLRCGVSQHAAAASDALAAGYPFAHHPTHEAGSPVADQSFQQAWMLAAHPGRQLRGVIGLPEGIFPVVDMGSGKS